MFSSADQSLTISGSVTSPDGTVTGGNVSLDLSSLGLGSAVLAGVTNGAFSIGVTLAGGTASANYTISATYKGSTGFPASSAGTGTVSVSQAPTSVPTVSGSAMFSSADQSLTISGSVTSSGGNVTGGNVSLDLSSLGLGSAILAGVTNGAFSIGVTLAGGTAAGNYTISATYKGSTDFAASSAGTGTVSVISAHPSLGALSPTQWTVNQPGYSGQITVAGGTGPYKNLSVTGLPAGLTFRLAGDTITISGKPTHSGVFTVNVSVKDSKGVLASMSYTLTINPALAIGQTGLPGGTKGKPYSQTLSVTDGTGSHTFAVVGSTLPPGLTLDPLTGLLSGTPTKYGDFSFTIAVTDSVGATSSLTYKIRVAPR
jgi:hypothetical protein